MQDIARSIVAINRDEKVSVLLVEQNSRMALRDLAARLRADDRPVALSGTLGGAARRRARQGSSISAANSVEAGHAMRILVVNPNTTASMTGKIGSAAARRAAGHEDHRRQSEPRPAEHRRAISTRPSPFPGLIDEMQQSAATRTPTSSPASTTPASTPRAASPTAPVIGIGEAAFHMASLDCRPSSAS